MTAESQVGYRVVEDFIGGLQNAEAVGRTSVVSGSLVAEATTITAATFEVDVATLESDDDRRDNQLRGRLLETGTYPTATFTLTQPIELGAEPADLEEVTATATGDLTLHGVTRTVTFEVQARRVGAEIEVLGSIHLVFDDYGIDDPTSPIVSVRDEGELEFLLVLAR